MNTQKILWARVRGVIDPEEGASLIHTLESDGILKSNQLRTLDIDGNPLVVGQKYTFRGNLVKVTKEVYGEGNMFDTYYRVFFIDQSLDEKFCVVDGRLLGLDKGFVYTSRLKPIEEL